MQHLENDMDDLFRRAAESYPLNEGQSQWKEIEQKIRLSNLPEKKKEKTNFRKFLLLFLLLAGLLTAIVFVVVTYVPGNKKENNKIVQTNNNAIPKKENAFKSNVIFESKKISNPDSPNVPGKLQKQLVNIEKLPIFSEITKDNNQKHPEPDHSQYSVANDDRIPGELIDENDYFSTLYNKNKIDVKPDYKRDLEIKSLTPAPSVYFTKKNSDVKKKSPHDRFSISLVAGTDLNKVSSKPFMLGGFNAGLLGGYNINSKFFIETGVLVSKKKYNSYGHDFSMKKIGGSMPAEMVIDELNGMSDLLELPINAGYRAIKFNRGNVYFSTGTSAYLVMRENNHYNVTMNGAAEKMVGIYKKNTFLLPATINLAAGAEKRLNSTFRFSTEIYFRFPVEGIGVGELPVTTAGLRLGLKKTLR